MRPPTTSKRNTKACQATLRRRADPSRPSGMSNPSGSCGEGMGIEVLGALGATTIGATTIGATTIGAATGAASERATDSA